MRRVQSIALVHETLSVSIDEAVDFDEIVDRLLVMLGDVMGSAGAGRGRAARAASARSRPRSRPRWCWCSPSWCRTRSSTPSPTSAAGTVAVRAPTRQRGELTVTIRRRRRRAAGGLRPPSASDRLGPADRAHAGLGRARRHGRVPPRTTRIRRYGAPMRRRCRVGGWRSARSAGVSAAGRSAVRPGGRGRGRCGA